MGFLSQIANVFTGSEDAKARKKGSNIQQQEAITQAGNIGDVGATSLGRLDPLANVGARGIDLAGFIGDPNAQAQFAQNNPLFDLGLQNLNEQTQQSAASRGRSTAGDTLTQLQNNATLAAQPLIDRQRQDILNLLNINQGVTGQQIGLEQATAMDVANLLAGGAAAKAGGIVGAQNARTSASGNIIDVASMAVGAPPGTFTGGGGLAQPIPGGRNTANSGFNMGGGL